MVLFIKITHGGRTRLSLVRRSWPVTVVSTAKEERGELAAKLRAEFAFARQAPEKEIRETLLHEIAHALVGKAHHHDAVWRATAGASGCSGRRCHELRFSLPRSIVKCDKGCWVATAERRHRGVCCKHCRGSVMCICRIPKSVHGSDPDGGDQLPTAGA